MVQNNFKLFSTSFYKAIYSSTGIPIELLNCKSDTNKQTSLSMTRHYTPMIRRRERNFETLFRNKLGSLVPTKNGAGIFAWIKWTMLSRYGVKVRPIFITRNYNE